MQRAGYKLLLLNERQIRFGTTPSFLSCQCTPWLGKSQGSRLLAPGRSHQSSALALFLGFFLNYLLLATAEKADWVKWPLGVLRVWTVLCS